jgi:hypothetical protein
MYPLCYNTACCTNPVQPETTQNQESGSSSNQAVAQRSGIDAVSSVVDPSTDAAGTPVDAAQTLCIQYSEQPADSGC